MEICPRCGATGYRSVEKRGNRKYIYYIHKFGEKRRKCYIGPIDGYNHAEKLHSLDLDNLESVDYIEVASNAIHGFARKFSLLKTFDERRAELARFGLLVEKVLRFYSMLEKELELEGGDG
ncbi:MAG: hypothetical protein QXT64_01825 [Desulfurococcaceae archaeon]